jgi:RecJ-like exonuclease
MKTIECPECCGEGTITEQFEPVPGGNMPGDDQMGTSVRCKVKCPVCKGKMTLPVPDDYEECGECGYDHSYEYYEALLIHQDLEADHSRLATGED